MAQSWHPIQISTQIYPKTEHYKPFAWSTTCQIGVRTNKIPNTQSTKAKPDSAQKKKKKPATNGLTNGLTPDMLVPVQKQKQDE